jgi:glycerophosphoryl diester phosphodiesterase
MINLCQKSNLMSIFLKNLEKKFHVQGHRGVRGLMPENTIESCIEAVRLGFDGLEIDVVCSEDGQIVVSHDPWMSPSFCSFPNGEPVLFGGNQNVNLYKIPYSMIRQFDCGSKGNNRFPKQKAIKAHKPTLIELIKTVFLFCETNNYPKPFFNIEVKSHVNWYGKYVPMPNDFIKKLKAPLSILPLHTYYVSSFDPIFLKAFKKANPETTIAFLTENRMCLKENLRILGFKPDIFSPYYRFLNNATIRLCKKMGIDLIVWTVNDINAINRLRNQGIRGIISDYYLYKT